MSATFVGLLDVSGFSLEANEVAMNARPGLNRPR